MRIDMSSAIPFDIDLYDSGAYESYTRDGRKVYCVHLINEHDSYRNLVVCAQSYYKQDETMLYCLFRNGMNYTDGDTSVNDILLITKRNNVKTT